jgi:adenylate cyclase
MSKEEDIKSNITSIIKQVWNDRDGQVVPETSDITLTSGGAVNLDATMLYADLADSTELAMYDRKLAAKVYKAFLMTCSTIIKDHGGVIRSFDGDRVMGVFIGNSKNSNAAKCALNINYAFLKILKPTFEASYNSIREGKIKLAHCVGIDTSKVLVVRAGIVNNSDLVWVGRSPNVAAKLSNIRNSPYNTYITSEVYNRLLDSSKYSEGNDMWIKVTTWNEVSGISTIYKSSYWWIV